MSTDQYLKGNTINLYANNPIVGPTPVQTLVAVPTVTGGGHGPSGSTLTITSTTTPAAVGVTVNMNCASNPLLTTWPRTATWTIDSTGLLSPPVVTNNATNFTLGSVATPCQYLKGRILYNFLITTTVANPTAATGYTVAPITFTSTAVSSDAITQATSVALANIANSTHVFNYSFIHEFHYPFVAARTTISFTLQVSYADGGTAQITVASAGAGLPCQLIIDE